MTKDGGETDMDLGHYERFIDIEVTRASNLTAGQVYQSLIAKERRGDFLGGTIQAVSHVTNEIKGRILSLGGGVGRGGGGGGGWGDGGGYGGAAVSGGDSSDAEGGGAG